MKNFQMMQPTQHAEYRLGLLLKESGWTIEEMFECVDEMTLENLQSFVPQLLSRSVCSMRERERGGGEREGER